MQEATIVSFSQCGEDLVLWNLLKNVKNGRFVDIGCADPVKKSVSKLFYDHGWRGVNIDPRKQCIDAHEKIRPEDLNLNIAVSNKTGIFDFWEAGGVSTFDYATVKRIGENIYQPPVKKKVDTLTNILQEYGFLHPIHFIKIDVENHEQAVLEGIDFKKIRPWIFVIEATLPNSEIPSWEGWEPILLRNGYRFYSMEAINRYYIAEEVWETVFETPRIMDLQEKFPSQGQAEMAIQRIVNVTACPIYSLSKDNQIREHKIGDNLIIISPV